MKVKSPEIKPGKSDVSKRVLPVRNRIKYSAVQLRQLEKVFLSSQYPDSSILEDLSNTINIDVERLSIWFQNRRSKFKRQSKDGHVAWMRKQLYHGGTIQSRDSSQKERCHVLTPRAPSTCTDAADKARSNLHYLPSAEPSYPPTSDYTCSLTTSSTYPSPYTIHDGAFNDTPGTEPTRTPLQHYPTPEVSYQEAYQWAAQPTGPSWQSLATGTYPYQSYSPFDYPSVHFPQIGSSY
ncbi:homeobox protein OTX1 B-like [Haliotis rufescens]|uniref:homeobox protein OTX1 B-like n=1 Tax=Haliotis rufescens TaxID=6454 RepID=UPI001EB02734|nr:homeobox protein OTX1 B-like [Haliotis rufescens]